ncbi:MAG: hypothetical protein ACOYEC_05970 [Christensenellales bacterium]|jgi:hypothetical protein|nr:hypothetical protein [Clostridiales bacterium]
MIRITSDVLDITDRLKAIDERYEVYYNKRKQRYELYSRTSQGRASFELAFPFDALDQRSVEYCLKTRRERANKLYQEMLESERLAQKRQAKELAKKAEERYEKARLKGILKE